MSESNDIPGSELEEYWRGFFPESWRSILRLAAPFYSAVFEFKPARCGAESELRAAMDAIAPGDPSHTPMGKPKRGQEPIFEFSTVVQAISFVIGPEELRVRSTFRSIVENHVGGIHDDIQRELRPAFFGTWKGGEAFNLKNRIDTAVRNSVERTWGLDRFNPTGVTLFSSSVSSVLFAGLHFASVGDSRRDFGPLLFFLRSGNLPLGLSQKKGAKATLLLLCTD